MVVLTLRSDELHRRHPLRRLLGELARNRRVQRLELTRFTRAELTEQLAALLGDQPPARLVNEVHARSGGNPFFTEELLLADGDPGILPPSLQQVLLTRVVRLGDRTQQLLQVAAAAGPGATQPLLAAAGWLGEAERGVVGWGNAAPSWPGRCSRLPCGRNAGSRTPQGEHGVCSSP
jgi:predicted ATPase